MSKRHCIYVSLLSALVLVPATSQARWLNPENGRFQTMDTYEGNEAEPQSLHKYVYAADNPVNRIDPSGHFDIGIAIATLGISSFFAQIQSPATVNPVAGRLKLAAKNTTLGMVQRVLIAEVRLPGDAARYDFSDSDGGLNGVGAVIKNRVQSKKFPNSIEGVIKDTAGGEQFKRFRNYPNIPVRVDRDAADLERFANSRGEKVANYRKHMESLLEAAKEVISLTIHDNLLPAIGQGSQNPTPTMYFRQQGSGNPFDKGPRDIPEYRGTYGGNDFYGDRVK